MTVTSVGYAGTVGDEQWAEMIPRVGSTFYSVDNYSSFRVTIAGGTRTVSVAAGGASAVGIYDVSNAPITKALDSVPSGTRWDLVVLRRTWATKVTSVEVVQGGSSKVIPTRNVDTGTTHDQPLALVRVQAGSTSIQEIVDLRCASGDGGLIAFDDLARSYLDRVGTSVRINDIAWSRVVDALGSPTWVSSDMTDTGWVSAPRGAGWAAVAGYPTVVRRIGKVVYLRGAVAVGAGGTGSVTSLCTAPAEFRPTEAAFLGALRSGLGSYVGELQVAPTGVVAVPVNYSVGGIDGSTVIPLHGTWLKD